MNLTPRQRIINCLNNNPMTAKDLASTLALPERDIEHHLHHVMKSLHGRPQQQFHMETPFCWHCHYEFKSRTKITRPSRCPQCKSEDISTPRFSIGTKNLKMREKEDRLSRGKEKNNPAG